MGAANRKSPCHFDTLFTKTNVPHILEKIFFNLDYESYKKCIEVNSTWNKLLTSERYQRKAKYVFRKEMQEDVDELVYASYEGKAEKVMSLLCSGMVDVNDCCSLTGWHGHDSTALCMAAWQGHNNVVNILIGKGADLEKVDKIGWTPLILAAMRGQKDVIQLLLHKGANTNIEGKYGETPLHYAAAYGHPDVVQVLLDHGADPNRKTKSRQVTPLHLAAQMGHLDVVKILLAGGADRHMTDTGGRTPTQLAANNHQSEVVELLYIEEVGATSTIV